MKLAGFQWTRASFRPEDLFTDGIEGAYYNPRIRSTLYQNSTLTTPVTSPGDPVGGVFDISGNGYHAVQSVSADRLVYGVEPEGGRRNLLEWTEELNTSPWAGLVAGDVEPVGNGAWRLIGFGGAIGERLRQNIAATPIKQWVASVEVKGEAGDIGKEFRLELVRVGGAFAGSQNDVTLTEDWQRISVALTLLPENTGISYRLSRTGDNFAEAPIVRLPQLEPGPVPTPYQRVRSQYEVTETGKRSLHYLSHNLINQFTTRTLPAGSYTIALAGNNGIWIDTVEHAGGAFNIGPTTYTGGPAGILSVIGQRMYGGVIVEGELTATQRARVVSYFKSLGSGPEFRLGPELKDEYVLEQWGGSASYNNSTDIFTLIRSDSGNGGRVKYEVTGVHFISVSVISGDNVRLVDGINEIGNSIGMSPRRQIHDFISFVRVDHPTSSSESEVRINTLRKLELIP